MSTNAFNSQERVYPTDIPSYLQPRDDLEAGSEPSLKVQLRPNTQTISRIILSQSHMYEGQRKRKSISIVEKTIQIAAL